MMSLEKAVRELIADRLKLDLEQVQVNARFIEDLGADSLDIVEMIMQMEELFGVTIPDEDAEKIKTVNDAISYLKEKGVNA
ncbi:MAG: acyl carrier protein [Deltaproteobacteria bacterium]|nr:acyl carrier protein [Deltaproteobacteria bacterium]MCL5793020.1 acyl carrier protein [Deltaproteobacteria bacterium]